MEPFSVLLAAGAVAVYAAHRADKMSEKLRRGPSNLPDLLAASTVDDDSMVVVVAVHFRHVELAPHLAGERIRARVKFGPPGDSKSCESEEVEVPKLQRPVAANFVRRKAAETRPSSIPVELGGTCLFLHQHQAESVIRLRIVQAGVLGKTLAKAEMTLTPPCARVEERDLFLVGADRHGPRPAGNIGLTVETWAVPKGALRHCLVSLDAQEQTGSFLTGTTPVQQGIVVNRSADVEAPENHDDEAAGATEVLAGLPVSQMGGPLPAGALTTIPASRHGRRLRTLPRSLVHATTVRRPL